MRNEGEYEVEYGSVFGALFVNAMQVDSEGNEIPVPVCDKCNDGYMTYLIGRKQQVWMCSCGQSYI